jgi:hypothetical protein
MALHQACGQGAANLPIPEDWEIYNLTVMNALTKTAALEMAARIVQRTMPDKLVKHAQS